MDAAPRGRNFKEESRMNSRLVAVLGAFGFTILGLAPLHEAAAQSQGKDGVVPAKAELSPLDQPLAWLRDAKQNYGLVKDYSCTLVSQERVKGTLQEEAYIELKMRPEPFSVSMRWLAPKKSQGQEVVYVHGKNKGKMRVKSTILGGNLGFMNIDINDPRVTQHSRHSITEAGIGNMIDTALRNWEQERKNGKTDVKIGEFKYDQRDCYRLELTRSERRPELHCYRTVMYLDKQSKLPIRVENYDYPRQGGPPGGDLLEMFSYAGLRFNVGLKDADFDK
jgi:hypothetical protein